MHDELRRRALQSGKTISRKARSRQSSQPTSRVQSPAGSRQGSRVPSRNGSSVNSDDDGSVESDDAILGTNTSEASEDAESTHVQNFEMIVENLLDRSTKRQNWTARETNLKAYGQCLRGRYEGIEIDAHETELLRAFLKSISAETSENEVTLALDAISLTFITSMPSEDIFQEVSDALKKSISDSFSRRIKAAAIHALGITTFFSGFSEEEMADTRAFLLGIVTSDGASIDALDAEEPVVAAIQEYGFLATIVKNETREEGDFSAESEDAVEAFVDQLSSSDPEVQITAGECIALLYEIAYTPMDAGEYVGDTEHEENFVIKRNDPFAKWGIQRLIKRYSTYRRTDQLEAQLESFSKLTMRSNSRKKNKELRSNLADVLNSIQNPTHGPHYQAAIDQETGEAYGSRMTLKVGAYAGRGGGIITVDRWSSLFRYEGLKRVLEGYFPQHAQTNELISDLFQIKRDQY